MSTDRRSRSAALRRWASPDTWGIPARSAAVSAIVVFLALAFAGTALDAILYQSLIVGIDDATAARVRDIAEALRSESHDEINRDTLLATNHQVVAVQVISPDGKVLDRSGTAPDVPLVPVTEFDFGLRRGMSDDAVANDDMRVSGQRVPTPSGDYTIIVGGGSEAIETMARVLALLLACSAPVIVAVAAGASYWLVRRSLQSVDRIRSQVAEISTSDLAERVPVPSGRDQIAALAVTMNEMLSRLEAGHRAQQRFIGDASHELRSPLATIISGLEVAEAHPELLDADLAVNTLLPEAQRMSTLIQDLLVLARSDEQSLVLRRESVQLGDLAEVEADRAVRDTKCTIRQHISQVEVTGDPIALSRVVRNLMDNAVRHAHSCVTLEINSDDGAAAIVVSDDGAGIAPDDRQRVFERFVRLDADRARSSGGSGLGLAIVAELVAAHGGSVAIVDRPGGGTQVVVRLPQQSSL